jgi:hypothetical protein
MSIIVVKQVLTSAEKHVFLTFPWRIYKGDPLWVPPLLSDREKMIDPARGVWFEQGIADFFIAWRDGQPVGTICAAEDKKGNAATNRHDCVFGFFELIEDYEVALALWTRAAQWAREHGLNTLFGPISLDYEDAYGILIEGRDRPPAILCGHTPVYYQGFVERYGFTPSRGDNLAYEIDVTSDSPNLPKVYRMANLVRAKKDLTIRDADF